MLSASLNKTFLSLSPHRYIHRIRDRPEILNTYDQSHTYNDPSSIHPSLYAYTNITYLCTDMYVCMKIKKVCMYASMYVCVHVRFFYLTTHSTHFILRLYGVCMYVCMCACLYVYKYVCMSARMHACLHISLIV